MKITVDLYGTDEKVSFNKKDIKSGYLHNIFFNEIVIADNGKLILYDEMLDEWIEPDKEWIKN